MIVGLKAKSVCPGDEKFADNVALEHIVLIAEGTCVTLLQQLLQGMIDCSAPPSPPATERVANTFDPPPTRSQLKRALLDLLMPANAIQEAATNLLSLRQRPSETVLEFNIRFRSAITQFESAVERAGPNRPPLVALYVSHYESVVKPSLQCLQYTEKPAVSLKEAMEKTRRHEAAGISGNISAIAFNHPGRTATHSVDRQTRYRSDDR